MGRPKLSKSEKKKVVAIRMTDPQREACEAAAGGEGLSGFLCAAGVERAAALGHPVKAEAPDPRQTSLAIVPAAPAPVAASAPAKAPAPKPAKPPKREEKAKARGKRPGESRRAKSKAKPSKPAKATKPPKLFASSQSRYRSKGKTVTSFFVGVEGSGAETWKTIEGHGPTPGERKTDALNKYRALSK